MILILPVCALLFDYSLAFSQDKWGVKEFGKCPPQETRFRVFMETSIHDCVKQCAKRRVCKVVGYKHVLKMCELHIESVTVTDEIVDKHCLQIKMDTVGITQITDGCLCQDWQVCDVITRKCSYEECNPYASVQHLATSSGVVYGNMNSKGSKKRIRCNIDFHNAMDEYLTVCLATGQWSSHIECKANTANVAVSKPAEQSSVHDVYTASYGVDGKTKQTFLPPPTCFHTKLEVNPWWRVNLESLFYVTDFVLYNRVEYSLHVRAHDVEVKFGQTLDTLTLIDFISGALPKIYHKQLASEALTRYAQVSILSTDKINGDFFHLCEVELYGYAA